MVKLCKVVNNYTVLSGLHRYVTIKVRKINDITLSISVVTKYKV